MIADLILNLAQPPGEPEVPGAEGIHGKVDDWMGFDADGMEDLCGLPDQTKGRRGAVRERGPGVREDGVRSFRMAVDVPEYRPEFLDFMVEADRMFEQFLSLVREKIEEGVEAEGEHPVPWQQIQQRGESEPCSGRGEDGLDRQDEVQPGNLQAMLQYGSQAMAIDLLLTEHAGFKCQPVSK